MIKLEILEISEDNNYLNIVASVLPEYQDRVDIKEIIIDNQDTYINTGPSESPIIVVNSDLITNKKDLNITINLKENNVNSNDMLFVYIVFDILDESDLSKYSLNTVVNLYPIYQDIMDCIKEINNNCSIPKLFIDRIIRIKAVDLSIRTGNYNQAIEYWNKFFNKK